MKKHSLSIKSNHKLDAGWETPQPADYEVSLSDPIEKSIFQFMRPEDLVTTWTVYMVLDKTGLVSWVQGKIYDAFWEYLNNLKIQSKLSPKVNMSIKAEGQDASIIINDLTEDSASKVRLEIEKQIKDKNSQINIVI